MRITYSYQSCFLAWDAFIRLYNTFDILQIRATSLFLQ